MLTFCECGCPSFQQVFGCEVQPDLPPGHSDHEKGPVPAAGEDAEPEVDENNAAEEVPDGSEPTARYFKVAALRKLLTFDPERGGIPIRLLRARWMLEWFSAKNMFQAVSEQQKEQLDEKQKEKQQQLEEQQERRTAAGGDGGAGGRGRGA